MSKKFAWATLSDEQLLKVRLKNLHVKVEGTWLEDCLLTLHDELAEHGLAATARKEPTAVRSRSSKHLAQS